MLQTIVDFGSLPLGGAEIPLRIYGYGLMLVLGFLVAIGVAQWLARRAGENPEDVARIGLLSLVGGIVGARGAYVIQHWDGQFAGAASPLLAMLNVTSGGLIYYGGLLLAMALVIGYLVLRKLPVRRHLDIVAVPIMIGLAFGRAGCLLNGCCYGGRCEAHWPVGMSFPLYSKPLLKLDGRANPFPHDVEGPSPVYHHQLSKCQVTPPPELVSWEREETERPRVLAEGEFRARTYVYLPRDLHGALTADQTVMWADPNGLEAVKAAFAQLAGPDQLLDAREWQSGLDNPTGLLRGSEPWGGAICWDADRSARLSLEETAACFAARRRQFDADGDGKLSAAERKAANAFLQVDQWSLAGRTWSLPVKAAQPLGIANALVLAAVLGAFYRLRRREGQVFALLLVLYPITRFAEEAVRDDNPHDLLAGVLTHNQYTSLVLMTIGIALWLLLRLANRTAGPTWAQRLAPVATTGPLRRGRGKR